jgi:hypothetical protein
VEAAAAVVATLFVSAESDERVALSEREQPAAPNSKARATFSICLLPVLIRSLI